MEIIGAILVLAVCFLALALHQYGRASVWLVIATRAKANYEAALLRERRTADLRAEWEIDEIADAGKKVNALTAKRDAAVRAAKGVE